MDLKIPGGYTLRPEQEAFAKEASSILHNGGLYMVSAPCGIGKSLAALLASLPQGKKLVICYRTKTQLGIYLKELRALHPPVLAVSLFNRLEMCPLDNSALTYHEFTERCRRLRSETMDRMEADAIKSTGHGSAFRMDKRKLKRIREYPCPYYALVKIDRNGARSFARDCCRSFMDPVQVCALAKKKGWCAYESLKAILPEASLFLGTYHYLFNPPIREMLERSFAPLPEINIVVDEAHNLPLFARELLSAKLSLHAINNAYSEIQRFRTKMSDDLLHAAAPDDVYEAFDQYDNAAERALTITDGLRVVLEKLGDLVGDRSKKVLGDRVGGRSKKIPPRLVGRMVRAACGDDWPQVADHILWYGEVIKEKKENDGEERIFSYTHRVGLALRIFFESTGPSYVHLVERSDDGRRVAIAVRNMDGREITAQVLENVHGGILMSGTLTPLPVFSDLTMSGMNDRVALREFASPFPQKNRLILVASDVTSRLPERSPSMFERWAQYIDAVCASNRGNVACFFTSYALLKKTPTPKTSGNIIVEGRHTLREEVLSQLARSDRNVLLGVMGGKFAEGVDYPGSLLTCAISVGVPYAPWDDYQRALIGYMEGQFPRKGRTYAYHTPAALRLAQTCGRPIRSESDQGCMVILDNRVLSHEILSCLPSYLRQELQIVHSPGECADMIRSFWSGPSG